MVTSIKYTPSSVKISHLFMKRGEKTLYSDFSAEFDAGKTTVIMAPSGSGKTTLLDCIAGLLIPDSGAIFAGSVFLHPSYLFQEPRLLPWCTIGQNIMLPLENIITKEEADERAHIFLEKTGLSSRFNDLPQNLSGGEKQRAVLARAFAFPSPLLLMDEAFQSQDLNLKIQLMELMQRLLRDEQRTVILVTHDPREALCLGDRILLLNGEPLEIAGDIHQDRNELLPVSGIRAFYTSPAPQIRENENLIFQALTEEY